MTHPYQGKHIKVNQPHLLLAGVQGVPAAAGGAGLVILAAGLHDRVHPVAASSVPVPEGIDA